MLLWQHKQVALPGAGAPAAQASGTAERLPCSSTPSQHCGTKLKLHHAIALPLLQVLRFWGYFVDPVPGSTDEPWRLRKCALCFFLEVRSCLWHPAG